MHAAYLCYTLKDDAVRDLLAADDVTADTRLVLTNALILDPIQGIIKADGSPGPNFANLPMFWPILS